MRHLALPCIALVGLFIAGCGGGGSAGSTADQTINAGGLSVTAKAGGHAQVLTQTTNTVTLMDFSGAAFTNVITNPAKSLAETFIVFGRDREVYSMDMNGNNVTGLTTSADFTSLAYPSVNALGRVYFSNADANAAGIQQVFVVNADGSGQARISNGTQPDWDPSPTYDNASLLVSRPVGHYQIYKMTTSGGSPTDLDDGTADDYWPSQASNGTIAFQRFNSVTGEGEIWVMNSDGSNKRRISGSTSNNYGFPAISPDGTTVACFADYPATERQIIAINVASATEVPITGTDPNLERRFPAWSPDGRFLVYVEIVLSGSYEQIVRSTADGKNPTVLLQGSQNEIFAHPWWSPFPARKAYIAASGGTFGNTSHGFILGENGSVISSFLNVVSATGATTIAPDSGNPNNNMVQRITVVGAGTLTSLSYTNSPFASPTAVTVTGAKTVAVAYDPTNGQVSLVLPVASKMNAAQKMGGSIVYNGQFLGAYDGNGKNLAPHGASQVSLDGKTGKLISIR